MAKAPKPPAPAEPEPERRVITGDLELARYYGVTTKTVYDWRNKGLPANPVGRQWQYNLDDTDAWVEAATSDEDENEGAKLMLELRRAKVRAEEAKAARLEREEQIAAGQVLPRDEYELFATEVVQEARDRLLAIPKEFRRHVCKKCQGKLAELLKMIEATLADLAKLGEGPPECDR